MQKECFNRLQLKMLPTMRCNQNIFKQFNMQYQVKLLYDTEDT